MTKMMIDMSDDLNLWVVERAAQLKKSKPAVVIDLLESIRCGPEDSLPVPAVTPKQTDVEPEPAPPVLPSELEPSTLRKIAVTLDLLFQKHLVDHRQFPLTDHEREVAEERWEYVMAIRDDLLRVPGAWPDISTSKRRNSAI